VFGLLTGRFKVSEAEISADVHLVCRRLPSSLLFVSISCFRFRSLICLQYEDFFYAEDGTETPPIQVDAIWYDNSPFILLL
jgi:hypothetical protein